MRTVDGSDIAEPQAGEIMTVRRRIWNGIYLRCDICNSVFMEQFDKCPICKKHTSFQVHTVPFDYLIVWGDDMKCRNCDNESMLDWRGYCPKCGTEEAIAKRWLEHADQSPLIACDGCERENLLDSLSWFPMFGINEDHPGFPLVFCGLCYQDRAIFRNLTVEAPEKDIWLSSGIHHVARAKDLLEVSIATGDYEIRLGLDAEPIHIHLEMKSYYLFGINGERVMHFGNALPGYLLVEDCEE